MTDPTPEEIDAWRKDEAYRLIHARPKLPQRTLVDYGEYDEYRRLVRENVLPPAEPDQDTLDARAVLGGYFRMQDFIHQIESGSHDGQPAFIRAKQALTEIKARVRREVIAEYASRDFNAQSQSDVPTQPISGIAELQRAVRDLVK